MDYKRAKEREKCNFMEPSMCNLKNQFIEQFLPLHKISLSLVQKGNNQLNLKQFSAAFFYQIKENPSEGEEIENIARHFDDLNEVNDSFSLPYTFSLHALIGNINTDRFYTYRGENSSVILNFDHV
jgi:hypothetical protein